MTARHRARRTERSLRAAAAAGATSFLLLVAALLVGPVPALAQQPGATLVRLAQLTPELPDVELAVAPVADPRRGTVTATLHYGDVQSYRPVEPGDYLITMRPAGSTAPPAVSRTLRVESGTAYTIASVRHTKTADDLAVFTDDLTAPAQGRARVRVVNAAPSVPRLDVRDATGQAVTQDLPDGQAGPYADVAPGPMNWSAGPPSGPGTAVSFTVGPNQVASVLFTDADGGPRAKVVVDAGGPAVVPPGPVHAGFGGTAPRPGGPIGSAVLVVLAAAAGGVSLRLARRAG